MKLIDKLYNEIKDFQDHLFDNKFGFDNEFDYSDMLIKLNNMNDIVEDLEEEISDIKMQLNKI